MNIFKRFASRYKKAQLTQSALEVSHFMRHINSRLTYLLKGKRETAVRLVVATPRSRGNKS